MRTFADIIVMLNVSYIPTYIFTPLRFPILGLYLILQQPMPDVQNVDAAKARVSAVSTLFLTPDCCKKDDSPVNRTPFLTMRSLTTILWSPTNQKVVVQLRLRIFRWSELLSKQIKKASGKSPHLGEILRIPLFQAFSALLFAFM